MAQYPIDHARIEAARRLYLKYEGKQHKKIEQEMRALGYTSFNRRILHSRFERGHHSAGWIEKYRFEGQLQGVAESQKVAELQVSSATLQPPETVCNSETPVSDFDYFQAWLGEVSPGMTWTWEHQVHIYKKLKKVTDGECRRLMIFLPPRHGKSELVTVRYTAWRMKQTPEMNVILGSYNQRLANRFSRKIRKVLMDDYALSEPPASAGGVNAAESQPDRTSFKKRNYDTTNCDLTATSTPPAYAGGSDTIGPMFPFIKNKMKNTESEWETAVGGGLRAVGVGAGVTGFGANLIVIDDPVKSRAEAESAKMRERVWHWFNDDIYTRLEPNGSIVLIQTRWHEDDLAGRLLREDGADKWEVVNLPALAEEGEKGRKGEWEMKSIEKDKTQFLSPEGTEIIAQGKALGRDPGKNAQPHTDPGGVEQTPRRVAPLQGAKNAGTDPGVTLASLTHPGLLSLSPSATADPLGRKPGAALCPDRFDEAYFHDLREKIGSYSFASLYQQRPVPAEGGMFKRKWFENNIISAAPPNLRWKRGTDPGVSAGEKADYSASVRVAIDKDGNMYIADMFRRQIEYPELRRFMAERLKQERDTEHAIELAGHGPAIYQDLLKNGEAQGRAFRGIKINDPKMARALPWLALAEAGKVYLIRGAWNEEFLNETASFPMGTHDDQIDAVSLAFELATAKSKKSWGF